jgi:hypothetical protein
MTQQQDITEAGDAEARADMPWADRDAWDMDLLAFYRALAGLRHGWSALRRGKRRTVYLDAAAGTFAYGHSHYSQRTEPGGSVLTALNVSTEERTLTLPGFAAGVACLLSSGAAPRITTAGGETTIALAALTGTVLTSLSAK